MLRTISIGIYRHYHYILNSFRLKKFSHSILADTTIKLNNIFHMIFHMNIPILFFYYLENIFNYSLIYKYTLFTYHSKYLVQNLKNLH